MKKQVHFDINPHVVRQLGEELVSDEITALMEIVKNAYDADSSYVSIEISATETYLDSNLHYPDHKGYIVVEDDGFGMDEETILKSWLIISYSNKRDLKPLKKKTPKGRAPLGEKGLGRLSTQRLANICEIFSSIESRSDQVHVAFNWLDFEDSDKLSDVPVELKNISSKRLGTKLALLGIKHPEVWSGSNLENFKGLISQMISPYQKNRPFEVYLKVNGQVVDLEKENLSLRDIALLRFEFNFDGRILKLKGLLRPEKLIGNKRDDFNVFIAKDRGRKFVNFLFQQKGFGNIKHIEVGRHFLVLEKEFDWYSDIGSLEIVDGELANPGPFFGEINEYTFDTWIKEDEILLNVFDQFSNYREFAKNQAGIKLYRNGFAVKPFGLNGDDWLRLRDSQTFSSSHYYLRPANVIGYFAIDEYVNADLKDKTDREGLVSNAFSRNFEISAMLIRDESNRFIEKIRRSYNDFLNNNKIENNQIKTISQAYNSIRKTSKASKSIKNEYQKATQTVKTVNKNVQAYIKSTNSNALFSTKEEVKIANKINEIFGQLGGIEKSLDALMPIIEDAERLNETLDVLQPKITLLGEQLSNFSELAALGLTAEAVSHEFATIADKLSIKASQVSSKLEQNSLSDTDIFILIEYINSTVNGLKVQLRHMDPALKYMRERKDVFTLQDFINNEKEYYGNRFSKSNIDFNIEVIEDFEVNMNKGKLTQMVDNLFSNSEYWLKDRCKKESDFQPRITLRIEKPWIYISDNGYGIAPAIQDNIFEPFVTMKPKEKGRGLGLFIVQQLLDSESCFINLEPNLNDSNRKYILSINFANIIN